jgi:hypothetical protein
VLPSSSSSSSSSISRFEDEDRYAEDEDDYEADLRESMSNLSMPNSVIDPTSQEKFYHSGFTIALASTGQLARSCVPAVRSIYTDHPLTVKRRAFSFPISAFQLFSLSHPHTHTHFPRPPLSAFQLFSLISAFSFSPSRPHFRLATRHQSRYLLRCPRVRHSAPLP